MKYFSLGGASKKNACLVYDHRMKPKVGRNFTSERGEGVKGEVKNISLHWLQGIFETVPYLPEEGAVLPQRSISGLHIMVI